MVGNHVGPYELLDVVGKGGLGIVYRTKFSDDRLVAIKVVPKPPEEDTTEFMRRFNREAQVTSTFTHPHIIKTLDYGEQDDLTYIVMELMTGGSLKKRISGEPLPLKEAARIFEEITSALGYAHDRAIVHRDMKPDNILLDGNGLSYLSDFGLVKVINGNTTQVPTQEGILRGTPMYMSPEQWVGDSVDKRTDLYSLAVMLFEMLTGKLPFIGNDMHSMMQMHIYEPPPSLLALKPDLPPGLETVLEKALSKDRKDRYSTAEEFGAAFKEKIASNRPTLTLVPSIQLGRAALPQQVETAAQVTDLNKTAATEARPIGIISTVPISAAKKSSSVRGLIMVGSLAFTYSLLCVCTLALLLGLMNSSLWSGSVPDLAWLVMLFLWLAAAWRSLTVAWRKRWIGLLIGLAGFLLPPAFLIGLVLLSRR